MRTTDQKASINLFIIVLYFGFKLHAKAVIGFFRSALLLRYAFKSQTSVTIIIILIYIRQCRIVDSMVFIETSIFTKLLPKYMQDEEYRLFQLYLMENPDKGNTVVSSGGVRKIRWAINNKGKSGGIRVIYYWKEKSDEIWLPSMQRMKKTLYQLISLNK